MAAMTDTDKNKAARIFGRRVFSANTATLNHDDLFAAFGAIDGAFEGTTSNLPGTGAQSVAQRINQALPEPFASVSTATEKSSLLVIWTVVKYGVAINFTLNDGD